MGPAAEGFMHEYAWLAIYCVLIFLLSLIGGSLPLMGKISHSRLQYYLSVSAGFMLGASFFHVMPEAMEALKHSEFKIGLWMSLGVVGLFCIERFIAPHSHEMDGAEHPHAKEHQHHLEEHNHVHDHRAAAPAVAGWMAVLGLTIHTFMNGVGLAGQVDEEMDKAVGIALPGLTIFLAIFLHKPADALAISTVLSRKGVERWKLILVQIGFVSMVPIGAAAFCLTKGAIREDLRSELTGAALAFSAGTFLFIALSDLLPEVQFHRHDRIPLFLALAFGVVLMGGIAMLEPHEHEAPNGHVHPHHAGDSGHDGEDKDHGDHKHHKDDDDHDHHKHDPGKH
jgi:zinc and cadmium transporter